MSEGATEASTWSPTPPLSSPPIDASLSRALPARATLRRWTWGIFAILAIAALGLTAMVASPYWLPVVAAYLGDSATATKTSGAEAPAPLDQRIEAIERRVAAIEQGQVGTDSDKSDPAGKNNDLADRVASLEQRLAAIPVAPEGQAAENGKGSALADEVAQLEVTIKEQQDHIAKLETASRNASDQPGTALLIALGQLRSAMATGRPFIAELQAVSALAQDEPDIRDRLVKLDAAAESGLPSLTELSRRFDDIASEIVNAVPPPAEAAWRDDVFAALKRFFSIRRVALSSGAPADTEGFVAAAQAALQKGDLAVAVAALKQLSGPPAEVTAGWLTDAQVRLDADSIITELDNTLVHRYLTERAAAGQTR